MSSLVLARAPVALLPVLVFLLTLVYFDSFRLVRPRVNVQAESGVQFGELALPNPAVLRGTVTDPFGAPASNVVVGGWLPGQKADGTPPTTVIQIGSTQLRFLAQ